MSIQACLNSKSSCRNGGIWLGAPVGFTYSEIATVADHLFQWGDGVKAGRWKKRGVAVSQPSYQIGGVGGQFVFCLPGITRRGTDLNTNHPSFDLTCITASPFVSCMAGWLDVTTWTHPWSYPIAILGIGGREERRERALRSQRGGMLWCFGEKHPFIHHLLSHLLFWFGMIWIHSDFMRFFFLSCWGQSWTSPRPAPANFAGWDTKKLHRFQGALKGLTVCHSVPRGHKKYKKHIKTCIMYVWSSTARCGGTGDAHVWILYIWAMQGCSFLVLDTS